MDSNTQSNTPDLQATFRPGELLQVSLSAVAFFLVLCSYYILRPVRDDMAVQVGADRVHWLFSGTFALAMLAVPVFGWLVRRTPRAHVLTMAYGFLILNLLGFCVAFASELASLTVAALFFIWLSVFNLFVVSLFWSTVSDCFTTSQSHRFYGYIAAGGTAGALAGPAMTALLARHVSTSFLVGVSAMLLAGAVLCMAALRTRSSHDAQAQARPLEGPILAGIGLAFGPGKLRGVALLIVFYTTVSTALYVELIDLVGKTYADPGQRKAFFATLDLVVNGLSLLLQLLGTRRIVQRYGLRLALPALPLVVLAGLGILAGWATVLGFAIVQIVHRAGEYAVGRPGREMIYTTVDAESRYKAKNFIDIALYRANDAASAWVIALVRGMGLNAIVFVGLPAAAAWLLTAAKVGKQHDQQTGDTQHEPT